ncbi:Modification methylase AplI [compost metagenome]
MTDYEYLVARVGQQSADRAVALGYIDGPDVAINLSPLDGDRRVLPETTWHGAGSASLLDLMNFESHDEWLSYLHEQLPQPALPFGSPTVLDLFAGCGGLALGFEAAGFETYGFEMDGDAASTYRANLSGNCVTAKLEVGFDYGIEPDIIIGGPPCQPFSVIGHQRGPRDSRDGFPIFLDAVERLNPKLAIIENVRGLLYQNREYLRATVEALEGFGYSVDVRLLNARDYGVPQNRERVIIVASRVEWSWPEPVVRKPVPAGIALGEMAFEAPEDGKYLTASQDAYVASYEAKSKCVRPRDLHLDRPARTLTCRNFGGSTSDMHRLRLADGRRRMLRVREGARIQSFPDWFSFEGREASVTKQIGNAVPPLLGLALGRASAAALNASHHQAQILRMGSQMELSI